MIILKAKQIYQNKKTCVSLRLPQDFSL